MTTVLRFAAAFSFISVVATGCSGSAQSPSSSAKAPLAAPGKLAAIAGFTGFADKNANTLVFTRDPVSSTVTANSKITPESLSSVQAPSGKNGDPDSGDVDLVTIGSCANGGIGGTFSCDVELVSGFSRTLTNVYVQVDDASPSTGYDMVAPTNANCYWYAQKGTDTSCGDTNYTSTMLASQNGVESIPADHGVWWYNATGVDPLAIWPVLEPSGTVSGTTKLDRATVQWVFNNESNVAVYYHFTIFATEGWNTLDPFEGDGSGGNTYGSEGGKPKFGSDDDACDGATTIIDASTGITGTGFATSASITLPFDFTLFGVNSTNWFLCPYVGWFTNSASNCPGTDFSPSIGFPKSADYPDEQIFAPHWAEMEFGTAANDASTYDTDTGGPGLTAGRICMKQLAGTTVPNRIEIIEWRNMDLSTGVGDSLDFEMFLYEGTNEIDVYYPTMSKASGDTNDVADCTSKDFCRVGYQGSDIAGYSNGSTALSGDEKSSTNLTKSGKAYQFLPEP